MCDFDDLDDYEYYGMHLTEREEFFLSARNGEIPFISYSKLQSGPAKRVPSYIMNQILDSESSWDFGDWDMGIRYDIGN